MIELKYPLFDGEMFWDGAVVSVENGVITAVKKCDPAECGEGLLMTGLIDAHVHMGTAAQADAMLRSVSYAFRRQNGSAGHCQGGSRKEA